MNPPPDIRRRTWPRWVVALAGTVALVVMFVLGTLGWFANAFGIGTSCTDQPACSTGNGGCSYCAAAVGWIWAEGIGEWVLLAATATTLVLGLRRSAPHRRAVTIAACILTAAAVAWYAVTTAAAEHSF